MKTKNPVALNLPRTVPALIIYGRHVVEAMTGNVNFPSPNPPLSTVSQHLDALEAAQVKTKSRTIGSAAARDVELNAVEADLVMLKGYVSWVARQSGDQGLSIIESAGMSPKQHRNPPR